MLSPVVTKVNLPIGETKHRVPYVKVRFMDLSCALQAILHVCLVIGCDGEVCDHS